MKCFNCGAEITDDSVFCPECGSKVGNNNDVTNDASFKDESVPDSKDSQNVTDSNNSVTASANTAENTLDNFNSNLANNNAENNYFNQPMNNTNMPLQAGNNGTNKRKVRKY